MSLQIVKVEDKDRQEVFEEAMYSTMSISLHENKLSCVFTDVTKTCTF